MFASFTPTLLAVPLGDMLDHLVSAAAFECGAIADCLVGGAVCLRCGLLPDLVGNGTPPSSEIFFPHTPF